MTKRKLTDLEIEDMLDFIVPQQLVPFESAMSVVNISKNKFKKQLKDQLIYSEQIPELKKNLEKIYHKTKAEPGLSVGILCAQSIGERQTQLTLNSIDWTENILYIKNNKSIIEPIGQMIDNLLEKDTEKITHIPENKTEYLPLAPENGYYISSCDKNGAVEWHKIEAVTRHLPTGKLVQVKTKSGRSVVATQSKSFLVWNGDKFKATLGSDIKVGDVVPITKNLPAFKHTQTHFDMESIFPKDKYLYTTEIIKAREYKFSGERKWWMNHIGTNFILPYNRSDTCFGKRSEYFMKCPHGLIYIHTSSSFVSHIPDKIPLDNNFGFLVGIYLAEGWSTTTFVGIRMKSKDPVIRKKVTDWCNLYKITYHTVTSESSVYLKIHSALLARMFKIICETGSSNKFVPDFAYTAPKEFIKGLIDGYYSGDGTVNKKDGSIVSSSASKNLISGISFLLSYFDIYGSISGYQQKKNNVGSKNIKYAHILKITNKNAQQFAKEFTLTESNKQDILTNITLAKNYRYNYGRSQEKFPIRDVHFDSVVSVDFVDGTTEYVYDLTVATTRNFQLFNGLNIADTFHQAGLSNKAVVSGVPRFSELLNATKQPKCVSYFVHFTKNNSSIAELRKLIGYSIKELTFKKIAISIDGVENKKPEPWYEAFKILNDDRFANHSHCISIKINMDILFEYNLDMEIIAKRIEDEYADLFCVYSPPEIGQFDIFVDTDNITLPENRILYVDSENAKLIYLDEVVIPLIIDMTICGINGVDNVFYCQDKQNNWMIETDGGNFSKLLSHPHVNPSRVISNNVWDIYAVLGIEAARQFLIDEYMGIMEDISIRHVELLVEWMTFSGGINSISRYAMRSEEAGPLSKASFEETMDNFLKAGVYGQEESTKGVSASIICGKLPGIGSGMCSLKIDVSKLPDAPDIFKSDIVVESKSDIKTKKKFDLPKKKLILEDSEKIQRSL